MFDVTPEDIANLPDDLLRELVARLAAAELVRHGHSVHAVTAGGHQDAPDGGVDVRIEIEAGAVTGPNLARANIGFQVKRPDMARKAILREMRPGGQLRPVITELMAAGGAYIIASAQGSTSDRPLRERRAAMREALDGYPDADQLHTDFYDRTRLANWVREHPGIVLWVRDKVGRALAGWRPFGNWSNRSEPTGAPYLLDERVRIRFNREEQEVTALDAISRLRDMVRVPGAAVRLVGLSGVGKTRLVQALFDPAIGHNALPPAAAVYTDFHERTSPQPEGMAEDLLAQRRQAILIIDNCSSVTHARLAAACREQGSQVSLVTVEYDVREDEPEGTQVVEIGTASESLIEELVHRRYPRLSAENAHTVAHVSGGNARVALAIADTVREGEHLAGLRAGEIFDRLFHQRHTRDDGLLRAAEACALVYSFDGETEEGDQAELPVLAQLAQLSLDELFRHVQSMRDRDLVQSRSRWRALLPHALANHLATNALVRIRPAQLRRLLISSGHERLLHSFCHRLSFLHSSPVAVERSRELLHPGGVLGQLLDQTPAQHQLLTYLAPVAPEAALAAIERAVAGDPVAWLDVARYHVEVLRLLAWDAALFERCAALLAQIVRANRHRVEVESTQRILVSFCQPYRSGTHVSVAKRYALIAAWLDDPAPSIQQLGRLALHQALSVQVNSIGNFNFGARGRDTGYYPATAEELASWFRSGLELLARLVQADGSHTDFSRQTLAKKFPGLWRFPLLHDELVNQMVAFAEATFWREGWLAVRSCQQYAPEDLSDRPMLERLEAQLAPGDLAGRVRGAVLTGDGVFEGKHRDEEYIAYYQRIEATVIALGQEAAHNLPTLRQVALDLLTRPGRTDDFGVGLAQVDGLQQQVWDVLAPILREVISENSAKVPPRSTVPHMMRGFLRELSTRNRPLTEHLLEKVALDPGLTRVLPALQAAVGFDAAGLIRVHRAYTAGLILVEELHWLRAAAAAPVDIQRDALGFLAEVVRAGTLRPAIDALQSWLNCAEQPGVVPDAALIACCQEVLRYFTFKSGGGKDALEDAYSIMRIAKVALQGPHAPLLAQTLATRMGAAAETMYLLASEYEELILLMLERQPEEVLTALCSEEPRALLAAAELLGQETRDGKYALGQVDPHRMAAWCAANPGQRMPLLLRTIPAVKNDPHSGNARLTPHATILLQQSATPEATLQELVERIEQQSLRNGRGTSITHNAGALDDVMSLHNPAFQVFARGVKDRMLADGAYQLARETARDQMLNERFE